MENSAYWQNQEYIKQESWLNTAEEPWNNVGPAEFAPYGGRTVINMFEDYPCSVRRQEHIKQELHPDLSGQPIRSTECYEGRRPILNELPLAPPKASLDLGSVFMYGTEEVERITTIIGNDPNAALNLENAANVTSLSNASQVRHTASLTPAQPVAAAESQRPWIEIVEQPKSRGIRFRYKCEGRSAGSIPGENSNSENRTFPSIRIRNFQGPAAIVVVSCVTRDNPNRPHPHTLVGKDCNKGVCTVKLKKSNTASFPSLGIQCVTKKETKKSLEEREAIRVDPFNTGYFTELTSLELNVVSLCFQAFLPDESGNFTRVVTPVVSHPIFDKKAVNELIICRLSRGSGYAKGGDEVFLLCEKVNKDDIQVRFYEETEEGTIWEEFAEFSPQDVHRQFAIVFRTPSYKDIYIRAPVTVQMQLVRPSDSLAVSDPKPFQYVPCDPDPDGIVAKRKRKMPNFDMQSQGMMPPGPHLPLILNQHDVKDEPMDAQDTPKDKLRAKLNRKKAKQPAPPRGPSLPQYSHGITSSRAGPGVPMATSISYVSGGLGASPASSVAAPGGLGQARVLPEARTQDLRGVMSPAAVTYTQVYTTNSASQLIQATAPVTATAAASPAQHQQQQLMSQQTVYSNQPPRSVTSTINVATLDVLRAGMGHAQPQAAATTATSRAEAGVGVGIGAGGGLLAAEGQAQEAIMSEVGDKEDVMLLDVTTATRRFVDDQMNRLSGTSSFDSFANISGLSELSGLGFSGELLLGADVAAEEVVE